MSDWRSEDNMVYMDDGEDMDYGEEEEYISNEQVTDDEDEFVPVDPQVPAFRNAPQLTNLSEFCSNTLYEIHLNNLEDSGEPHTIYDEDVNEVGKLNKIDYHIPGYDDWVRLTPIERVGGGSYGDVILYQDDHEQYSCVVKIFHNDNDPEYDYVETLIDNECPLVRAYPMQLTVNNENKNVVVMDQASGSLNTLIDSLETNQALAILLALLKAAQCLQQNGWYYTDYKVENMLWRCETYRGDAFFDDDVVKIYMADLGSLVPVGEDKYLTFTYPPPENEPSQNPEATMLWGIGMTILGLYGDDIVKYILSNINQQNYNYINNLHFEEFLGEELVFEDYVFMYLQEVLNPEGDESVDDPVNADYVFLKVLTRILNRDPDARAEPAFNRDRTQHLIEYIEDFLYRQAEGLV